MDGFSTQNLPFSAEAEMSVLGAVLIDGNIMSDIASFLKEDDFYISANKEIYGAMYEMFSSGESIDAVTLISALERRGSYEGIGGGAYIARLIEMVPGTANAVKYASIVSGKSNLRKLIDASGYISQMAMSGEDADLVVDRAEQAVYEISQSRDFRDLVPMKDVIISEYNRLHQLITDPTAASGLPTGFSDVDRILVGGMNRSDLIIIAARPGMGKTSFALNVIYNVAKSSDRKVAVFSLEMSKEQLASRMLSSAALVDNEKLRLATLSDDDWENLAYTSTELSRAGIYIDDTSAIGVTEIKAKCRRIKGLGLVVIDYLQLMQGSGRSENRVNEVSEISRGLKVMAKELNVPVICLSQLSRSSVKENRKPQLSDLRESGAIEQDADVVMFIHREEVLNPDTEERNVAEVIFAKNRHGSTGKCRLRWLGEYTRFETLDNRYDE